MMTELLLIFNKKVTELLWRNFLELAYRHAGDFSFLLFFSFTI